MFRRGVGVRDRFYRTLWKIAFVLFAIHSFFFWGLTIGFPDSSFSSFIRANANRLWDPTFWLVWFLGLQCVISYGIFSTTRYIPLIVSAFIMYILSVIPALLWGFPLGFLISAGAFLFLLLSIIFSKRLNKSPTE